MLNMMTGKVSITLDEDEIVLPEGAHDVFFISYSAYLRQISSAKGIDLYLASFAET